MISIIIILAPPWDCKGETPTDLRVRSMHAGKQDPAAGRDGHWPSVLPQRGNLPCCAEHCSAAHWRVMREKPSAISSLLSQVCPLPHPTAASRDPAAATFPRWGKDMCRVAPGARPDLRIPTDTSAALRLHRRGGGSACPAGMSPPGGTEARQAERSGAFAVGTTSPDLSVVIRQGSAGRGKPLPYASPVSRMTPHPPQCAHWGTFPSRGRHCG